MRLLLAVALAFAGLATPGFAQDEGEERVSHGCKRCNHRGVVACKKHDEGELAEEAEVQFCAVAARCEDCAGTFMVDCGFCIGGPDSLDLERRRGRMEGILKASIAPEKLLERELAWIRTAHFDLVVDVDYLKNGTKKLDAHEFLHRLAREAEAAAAMLDEHLKAKPHNYGRASIYFWEDLKDHREVNRELLGTNTDTGMKLYGPKPKASSWTDSKGLEGKALNVAANGVHIGIHLLLSSAFRGEWIGDKKAGWFDVGAAHWYEEQIFKRTATYCVDEANADLNYKNGQWRSAVRADLSKNKDSILPELTRELSGTLWEEEHALSWSLYDWLVTVHPDAVKPFLMGFKDGKEMRELCRKELDMTLRQVEDAWRAWVAETYPTRDPKVRKHL